MFKRIFKRIDFVFNAAVALSCAPLFGLREQAREHRQAIQGERDAQRIEETARNGPMVAWPLLMARIAE
jgi:hypothetical protein